jgi:hypothetical protein
MKISNSKRSLLSVHLISCIIINFLKLKELYSNIKSTQLIDKLSYIKDFSNFGFDILNFNILSIILNIYPYYKKCKNIIKKFSIKKSE